MSSFFNHTKFTFINLEVDTNIIVNQVSSVHSDLIQYLLPDPRSVTKAPQGGSKHRSVAAGLDFREIQLLLLAPNSLIYGFHHDERKPNGILKRY